MADPVSYPPILKGMAGLVFYKSIERNASVICHRAKEIERDMIQVVQFDAIRWEQL